MHELMTNKKIWVIVVVSLTVGTFLSGVISAVLLDAFIVRPVEGGGSVTTIIPGFTYATATVMKVCILAGLASIVIALINRGATNLPIWGITSTALAPLTPLVGTLAILIAQRLAFSANEPSISEFSLISRVAVFISLFFISLGAVSAVISLVKRERPRMVPVVGLILNATLIALFWHFEFYAVGFDQDTWAPQ